MAKVNDQEKYDPDFGKGFYPDCDSVYIIDVIPSADQKEKKFKKWKFYLLLPRINDEEEEQAILHYAIEALLEGGETVKVYSIGVEEFDGFKKSTPVAMFDPETLKDFFWLVPPKYLMH